MIAEHVFVTTLDPREALSRVRGLLSAHGFEAKNEETAATETSWDSVVFTRGRKNAARAKSVSELPQEVRLGWDRGRVTVAVSIKAIIPGFSIAGSTEPSPTSPKVRAHADLLLAIAEGIERLLAKGQSPTEAAARWDAVEKRIEEEAQARRRRGRIRLVILLVSIVLLIGLFIWVLES